MKKIQKKIEALRQKCLEKKEAAQYRRAILSLQKRNAWARKKCCLED